MIGSEDVISKVEELLGEIAHKNEQNYGYILYLTDVSTTKVLLGKVKDEEDNQKFSVYYDVIYGDITGPGGDSITLSMYDFFELDKKFGENIKKRIDSILECLNQVTKEERETIETLEKILGD